jgi:hypothetical protein
VLIPNKETKSKNINYTDQETDFIKALLPAPKPEVILKPRFGLQIIIQSSQKVAHCLSLEILYKDTSSEKLRIPKKNIEISALSVNNSLQIFLFSKDAYLSSKIH